MVRFDSASRGGVPTHRFGPVSDGVSGPRLASYL